MCQTTQTQNLMAEADNVLGISGQMDISDIQSTIERLCDSLQRIGVETDSLSDRMTAALNEIAKSDDDIATKTQQAMSLMKDAMEEAKKGMSDVPEMMRIAQERVDGFQTSINKLNTELASTPQNSSTYGEITRQLETQQTALKIAQDDVNDLTRAYSAASEAVGKVSETYDALNASVVASSAMGQAQTVTNVGISASATAAAVATGAEAAAHTANAAAATTNTQAENANVEATKNLTSSLQEYISVASGRAEIERMQSENSKELRNDIKMYEQSIKDIQATLDSTDFSKKISDATAAIEKQQGKIETYKEALANISPEDNTQGRGTTYYNSLIDSAQQKIAKLQEQIEEWQHQQRTLNKELEEYNTILDAAKQIQGGETIIPTEQQAEKFSIDVDSSSLQDLRTQLDDNKSKLQDLESEADKFNGKPLGDSQKQKLADLNKEIEDTKEKISTLHEALRQKNEETIVGSLRNQLSELKDKVSEFGNELKEKITAPFNELSDKVSNSSFGKRFSAEFSQVKAGMDDFKNGAVNVLTANGKLQENVSNLSKAIGGLGIPLNGALTGIKAVTKALWSMCATPIGAILTVIILGLKAVQTWMTKSAEGQKVYTRLMAFFGSLMSTITDMVVTFGGFLYHCFADANGPLRDFGNNFIRTFTTAGKAVMGILGGLGTALKGIFTLDWDTFKKGVTDTWGGLKNAGAAVISALKTSISGVVGVFGTVKDFFTGGTFDKMSKQFSVGIANARKMADLAGKQQEAEIAIGKAKKTQAELDIKIAENREKIYQLTGKEKIALIEETKALQRQKYDGILDAQKKMLSYQQQRMKLHTNSLQDIAKERELSTDILRTEAQRAASTRMLTRQEEAARRSLERQDKSAAKAEANEAKKNEKQNEQTRAANNKYDEVLYNNDNAREKTIVDLEGKIADARVAAMKEGFSKTQAERKRQQEKELQQLQEQEEAAVAAELKRVKAEFDAQNAIRKARGQSTLTWDADKEAKSIENTSDVKAIRKAYSELRQLTVGRQVEDERNAADELIKSHQSYTDKKLAIDKQYQIDLQAIDNAINEAQSRNDQEQVSVLQRTRNQRTVDYAKDKMQAAFDELKNSPDYVAAFTDIDKASTETLTKLIQRFEEVKGAAAASLNPQDAKTYFDTVNSLIDELISRDPVGMIRQLSEELRVQQQELTDSLEELRKAQELLNNVQNGRKDITTVKSWRADVIDGQIKMTPEYYTLAEAQEKVAKAEEHVATAGQQVARSQKQIEKASEKTLNEVSKLISAFNQVGNAIGGEAGQIINLISDIGNFAISSANAMMSVSTTASKAIQTLEKASAILTIISGAISIMSKVSSLFKTSDDYYQKYAKRQAAINSLRDSVNEYRLSVIKAQQAEKNWFATTGLQNLKDSWEQHTQIIKEYRDKLLEPQEIYKDKGAGLKKLAVPALAAAAVVAGVFTAGLGTAAIGALAGTLGGTLVTTAAVAGASAAVGWIAGSGIQSGVDSITYKNGQTAAINNLRIQTRHRTAFRSEKTADLRDWVRDNYGEDLFTQDEETGMLLINADLAQKVIDEKGGKLKGQTKETLEKLIELRKEYDKFEEDLKDYVSETYSPIVDNMTDAIWAWLSEGKDALQEFKESASKTFADIGKEMIKQMLLKEVFGTFQDDLYKLYRKYATGEVDLNQLTEQMSVIMGTTVDKFENSLPAVETFAEKYRDIMANLGFDVTGNQEQNASSKGVSTITYDQANFLVNLGTARNIALEQGNAVRQLIQLDTSQLKITTMQIQSDISIMRDIQEQGLTQITRIEVNTRPIRDILTVVQDIYRITKDNA